MELSLTTKNNTAEDSWWYFNVPTKLTHGGSSVFLTMFGSVLVDTSRL